MNALIYLLQVNLYLLLFYFFYFVILRNETFFKMNRFYLVGSALFSLIIPAMKAEWVKDLFITEKVQEFTQSVTHTVITPGIERLNVATVSPDQPWLTTTEWLWLIYVMVSVVFLINFLRKLYKVNRAFKMKLKGRAFSFFGRIVVDEELEGKETIVKHELVHARQLHSADVIFFEIFLAMNWFNPIAYFYRNAIKNIHEFIADDTTASTLEDRSAYALLLVSNVFNTQPKQLTNNFFNQSLLKRRIIMLHKTKSRKVAILKYGLSAPLFAGMLIFSSATHADEKIVEKINSGVAPTIEGLKKIQLNTGDELTKPAFIPKSGTIASKQISSQKKTIRAEKENIPDNKSMPAEKLQEYVLAFFKGRPEETRLGRAWFSFDVDEQKHTGNFKIISSAGFSWEKELLQYLETFKDTISLTKGTYSFYHGFDLDDEKTTMIFSNKPKFVFGSSTTSIFHYITQDETKEEAGKIVNYIKVDYLKDPVILVDGNEVKYTVTTVGFKLAETIYPKKANIKVFKGEKAVEQYNESARQGLIVIKTGETTE
jgi:beta-lactamase regulating signal transducer with metallopeptidase domain